MKNNVLLEFEGISKKYCKNLNRSLLYGLSDLSKELLGVSGDVDKLRRDEFWALNDVSFNLKKSESIGLIGHNGAGKTTILKLINGLIKPTKGIIKVMGDVGALIALGTGFNPVLSGRENIWIAGAVLGYSKDDIERKFDEIIEFSEVGDFIDAPVKSYSSGMLARLGFSVAVHIEPDILLVDEVLAVGDLNFAIKCYKKISDFRQNGGSIILVSHSMYTIRTNCNKGIWIENGMVKKIGEASEVCNEYEIYCEKKAVLPQEQKYMDDTIEIFDIDYNLSLRNDENFKFQFKLKSKRIIEDPIIAVSIFNNMGQNLISNVSSLDNANLKIIAGLNLIKLKYEALFLMPGLYHINLVVAEKEINNQLAAMINCFKFEVLPDKQNFGAGLFRVKPVWANDI